MAVMVETTRWLKELGHPEPRDDSTANWEMRLRSLRRTTSARSSAGSMYDELAEGNVPEIWAGVGIGKTHHHCVVINAEGKRLLSRRVANDETELLALIGDVLEISADVLWAVDLNHGGAALLIGLLVSHGQPVAYLTGLAVHRASTTYKGGEGKTDAKDAFVIADQARVRRDLGLLRPGDEIAVDLRTLTTRRLDTVFDRTRQINRLRANSSTPSTRAVGDAVSGRPRISRNNVDRLTGTAKASASRAPARPASMSATCRKTVCSPWLRRP